MADRGRFSIQHFAEGELSVSAHGAMEFSSASLLGIHLVCFIAGGCSSVVTAATPVVWLAPGAKQRKLLKPARKCWLYGKWQVGSAGS